MAQQVNLCSPILLTQKKYFSAATMAASVGVFVVLGAALAGAWTWNLQRAAAEYQATMKSQATEMASLKAALERNKSAAQAPDPALVQQLEAQRQLLAQRRKLQDALQAGALQADNAPSHRLRFLADSTPAPVWITGVLLATDKFQVSGFTLEPEALNAWVARMATQPLLQGLQLTDVQVQNVRSASAGAPAPAASGAGAASASRNVWSFVLGSTRPAAAAAPVAATEVPR